MSEVKRDWDRKATKDLVNLGLSWEDAGIAVGLIAEHRQIADREGYLRGFNDGMDEGVRQANKEEKV